MKVLTYEVVTIAPRYVDAASSVSKPGDCAIVERAGMQRQLVVRCPDGCGEILSINLDPRAGPAWRLYRKNGAWSLFPSIDKPTGCLSHFILWRGHVLWCGLNDEQGAGPESGIDIGRILGVIGCQPMSFVQIADQLDEVPWDVLAGCRKLVIQGFLTEGSGNQRGNFWKKK